MTVHETLLFYGGLKGIGSEGPRAMMGEKTRARRSLASVHHVAAGGDKL